MPLTAKLDGPPSIHTEDPPVKPQTLSITHISLQAEPAPSQPTFCLYPVRVRHRKPGSQSQHDSPKNKGSRLENPNSDRSFNRPRLGRRPTIAGSALIRLAEIIGAQGSVRPPIPRLDPKPFMPGTKENKGMAKRAQEDTANEFTKMLRRQASAKM
ncbi:hypothetical protein M0R45_011364 [Rubus argutus]|uniref:Uncharacterized protein n=1 Tax=Rubus argutus TaxID=59490 RepID=A0AAW1YCN3_RUBAR